MSRSRFLVSALSLLFLHSSFSAKELLTSRPRTEAKPAKKVNVGETIRTQSGERRRFTLPDGSQLFLNQQTTLKVNAPRRLSLTAGEVYLEVTQTKTPFVVKTSDKTVTAVGTRFAVKANRDQTEVIVTQGEVKVEGVDNPIQAGQQFDSTKAKTLTAPRASHALAWTRELHIAGESPLVPNSQHAGGTLTVVDPQGQTQKLELRKYHIDVHIEDGFARTTIDQTYFNRERSRLEGTFHFPLPADASLSRLAMYVGGERMEGGMVEKDRGRAVYETIVHSQRDPALLEWLDGTTFKMRVFPLEPRQEKRIILSYTQRLSTLYDKTTYRFPAGHSLDRVGEWSMQARVKSANNIEWGSPSHSLKATKDKGDLILRASAKNEALNRDVVLEFEKRGQARFLMDKQDGHDYFMVRYRPDLAGMPQRKPRDWVVLFEASADRDPLLARAQIEIIRSVLTRAEPQDRFTVIAANTRTRFWKNTPQPLTSENVNQAMDYLGNAHLIGALDLDGALQSAVQTLKGSQNPWLLHVGSGIAAMGERRSSTLAQRVPTTMRYVGVGVGRRWKRDLMKQTAERTGGFFTQINPDEPIAWRGFELASTLNAPRLLNVHVTDQRGRTYLAFSNLVGQGEEVCAIARLANLDVPPREITITGQLDGKEFTKTLAVNDAKENAGVLPRLWARLEIERLLAEDPQKHRKQIIELSKSMYVMSPFTSMLVLENEAMYEQYKVDRGRKDHWALYDCPKKIKVVYEPLPGMPGDPNAKGKPSAEQVRRTILTRPELQIWPNYREEKNQNGISDSGISFGSNMPGEWGAIRRKDLFDADKSNNFGYIQRQTISANGKFAPPSLAKIPYFGKGSKSKEQALRNVLMPTSPTPKARPGFARVQTDSIALDELSKGELAENALKKAMDGQLRGRANDLFFSAGDFERSKRRLRLKELQRAIGPGGSPQQQGQGGELLARLHRQNLLYQRPSATTNARIFYDLVQYAPGMNTSQADIQAVLEAEAAATDESVPGTIDDQARQLFSKARFAGSFTLGKTTIQFDEQGRFAWDRTLFPGIREQVRCDGKTLLHLYPDLYLGARRTVSRFHYQGLNRLIPWMVVQPEHLARGADLKFLGDRTVALIPHRGKDQKDNPSIEIHFVFSEDGPIAEQRLMLMPKKKLLLRETYSMTGEVKIFNGKGKELASSKGKLERKAQDLAKTVTEPKELVVLPLPYRTAQHVIKTRKLTKTSIDRYSRDDLIAVLASHFGANSSGNLTNTYSRLYQRNHRELGFYVLLSASGQSLASGRYNVLDVHMRHPLAQYLSLHSTPVLRQHASQWAVGSGQWGKGFTRDLAHTHALFQRWSRSQVLSGGPKQQQAEMDRAIEYLKENKESRFGWTLLCQMQDRVNQLDRRKPETKSLYQSLAKAFALFEKAPGLSSSAQYERARCLLYAGKSEEARKQFSTLYQETLKDGLPIFDSDLREAMLPRDTLPDQWHELMRSTANTLIDKERRAMVLLLARQCQQLGDTPMTHTLLDRTLQGIKKKETRQAFTYAVAKFYKETSQLVQADELVRELLKDEKLAQAPQLWRLASEIAASREMPARRLTCLEKALDLEFQNLPPVINLQQVRQDYSSLLNHYQQVTNSLRSLGMKAPEGFLSKVVQIADRWRRMDTERDSAATQAADILRQWGQRELAWDYLTTPVGRQPYDSGRWQGLAQNLKQQGERKLADLAYASAFAIEPTNAQLLWDRAQNLKQTGNQTEAQQLFKQLAESDWQPRFRSLKAQAQYELGRRE